MIRVGRNAVAFFDLGQELIDEESGVFIREIIVFEAAIETWLRASPGGGNDARVDEYANGDGHFLFVDEIVHDDGGLTSAFGTHVAFAVLKNHQRSWFFGIVLRGHVDPIIALGAGIDATLGELKFFDFSLWHIGLQRRVGIYGIRAFG